jgi:diguanylate cyclase (GGDEF)-like protein/PAS domain S-box-containing protein
MGLTLAGGFLLIILLGLLGYFQTVRAMQESARRSRAIDARVAECISKAKDVALVSHDTSYFTMSYVYSGVPGEREQKYTEQKYTEAFLADLENDLKRLPDSQLLQAQCTDAERQNTQVCEPLEEYEIKLTNQGKGDQARLMLQTAGTAGRDRLASQINDLIGVNPTQYIDTEPRGLVAYQLRAEARESQNAHRALLIGEAVQGAILLLSLIIAVAVIRAASTGVRAVLRAQDDLLQSESRYRMLFEDNPHPMWVFDQASLQFLAVNDAALLAYGYSREEFLALKYGTFRLDGDPPAFDPSGKTPTTETIHTGERQHKKKDGSLFWVEIVLHPLVWGEYMTCMAIVQDVTDRHEAQAGLNQLAAIVTSSQDAIVGWNPAKLVTSWNPGAERLYGWTAQEMIGCSILDLIPEECQADVDLTAENLKAGRPIELPDTLRLHKEGHRLEVWVSTSPIIDADGKFIGASTISRDISEQKKAQALIRWQAHTDPLTRLPNRAFFQQTLEDTIGRGAPFAVLFIDLDQFKHVNDSLGHAAGDHLLLEVAARFERCMGAGDLLARMGGDEFTLLISGEEQEKDQEKENSWFERKAETLLVALARPLMIEGHELHVAASIGISRFPDDGTDSETLLKHADLAMYHAKESGRRQWQTFSPAMTEAAKDRLTLESSLRKAIDRDELIVLYQPQVSLQTGDIIGVEALVRWQHPELGLISPARFIPLAEETGLIVPLGEWVLRTACRQAAQWQQQGRTLRLSVNLSARQLIEPALVQTVQSALEDTGLSARGLDLELTESALVAQGEVAVERLTALRSLGVSISIDDFGTGYSSLAYLRRFPLDVLKVDRSFVVGLSGTDKRARQDQAVVRAVIDMAHALDLEVVAEGIETASQRDTLRLLGCDYMQGFLYSPPVTAERLEVLLPPCFYECQEPQAA